MRDQIAVISGGSATNELVPLFNNLPSKITYVLPISDNGGSTSEIIRVIGGPAIGDIRSRLTRLIPDSNKHVRDLLSFRLDSSSEIAHMQWNDIVEGSHQLWSGIPLSTKEIIRAFLVHVHVELLKRSKITLHSPTNKQFRYELASVGNLFLTAIRLFIGSLDSAIELFSKICDIDPNVGVLPCLNTNFSYHIGAVLSNGSIITGQSQISHPSPAQVYPPPIEKTRPSTPTEEVSFETAIKLDYESAAKESWDYSLQSDEESGNIPMYTHPELKKSQLHFHKSDNIEPLLSPIKRVFYISPYGEEICPASQSRVTSVVTNAKMIIYSIGSLMTSIIPIVILRGIGKAIISQPAGVKMRVLFLNGCEDRETYGLTAFDYVRIVVESAQYSLSKSGHESERSWNRYVTHLFYMQNSKIPVHIEALEMHGVKCVEIKRQGNYDDKFDISDLQIKLQAMTS